MLSRCLAWFFFLSRRDLRGRDGIVIEYRGQPAFGLRNGPAFAPGIVLGLIALDLTDAEVVAD